MPAPTKITKDMILQAGVSLVRARLPVSARGIAEKLGCSTQPIYSYFKNMQNLEGELYAEIQKVHYQKINSYIAQHKMTSYKAYGMGFIKFAGSEKELFAYLYMRETRTEYANLFEQGYINDVTNHIVAEYHCTKKQATAFHADMLVYSFGLAVMQYLGQNLTEEQISCRLTSEFKALYKLHFNKEF